MAEPIITAKCSDCHLIVLLDQINDGLCLNCSIGDDNLRECDDCGFIELASEPPDWINGLCPDCDPSLATSQICQGCGDVEEYLPTTWFNGLCPECQNLSDYQIEVKFVWVVEASSEEAARGEALDLTYELLEDKSNDDLLPNTKVIKAMDQDDLIQKALVVLPPSAQVAQDPNTNEIVILTKLYAE